MIAGPSSGTSAETILGNFRELRPQRRLDHFAIPVDKDDVTVRDHDVEGAVMQQPVMGAAQQHEVLEAGLPASIQCRT